MFMSMMNLQVALPCRTTRCMENHRFAGEARHDAHASDKYGKKA